jgi:exoribonuclease-2
VTAWLEGTAPPPPALEHDAALPEQIHLHDAAAARLRVRREEQGALDLETLETRAVMEGNKVRGIRSTTQNRAQKIIEDVMIAANGVSAGFLQQRGSPSLRRVVRSPERWDRIERLAAEYGVTLPPDPDSRALADFLTQRKAADPLRFPDLSLAIVKMMGAGEYDVQVPGQDSPGHFGLAVRDYAHSTAPNRRYPDLLTHRLLKAALIAAPSPYPVSDLTALAAHCTRQEDAANKVERQIRKSAAALLLRDHIGQTYDALVTGASPKGTYVRVLDPPVEGRVVEGYRGLDVGDRVRVRLTGVQVEQGFIDFTV